MDNLYKANEQRIIFAVINPVDSSVISFKLAMNFSHFNYYLCISLL